MSKDRNVRAGHRPHTMANDTKLSVQTHQNGIFLYEISLVIEIGVSEDRNVRAGHRPHTMANDTKLKCANNTKLSRNIYSGFIKIRFSVQLFVAPVG